MVDNWSVTVICKRWEPRLDWQTKARLRGCFPTKSRFGLYLKGMGNPPKEYKCGSLREIFLAALKSMDWRVRRPLIRLS